MKKIFLTAVLAAILFVSCKKDKDTTPPPSEQPAPQIATIKQTISGNLPYNLTMEFVYDAEGRLKEKKWSGTSTADITEKYVYNGNAAQLRTYITGTESPAYAIDYTLNNKGHVEKDFFSFYNSSNLYEHNSAGHIIRSNYLKNGNGYSYAIYHYSGNNVLDSIAHFYADGRKDKVDVFTYETGRKNTIGDENKGLKMLGKDQAVPLRKRTRYDYNYPTMEGMRLKYYEIDYSYDYDNAGRIKKHTSVQIEYSYPGGVSQPFTKEVIEYTYKQY